MENTSENIAIKDFALLTVIRGEYPESFVGLLPGGEKSIEIRVEANKRLGLLEVWWGVREGLVNFILFFPISVTEQNRAQLTEKITEVNVSLAVLGFVLGTHAVSFRTHAFLDTDGSIPAKVVLTTIRQCLLMFEMFMEPLEKASKMDM